MDPITQGVLGATAGQVFIKSKPNLRAATVIAALSGMAPDLDVLIRSSEDPLMALEYHRHFTHSLLFIPLGALICTVVLRPFFRLNFWQAYLAAFAGYATHGLLDACTSYGTQLLLPFSSMRVAWNNISIIDPLFTLPLLIFSFVAWKLRKRSWAIGGLCFAMAYLSLGWYQMQRAQKVGMALAHSRGHLVSNVDAKPALGSLLLWKSIYEYEDRFFVDAVRTSWKTTVFEGASIPKLNIKKDLPWLDTSSVHAMDLERFRWFAAGYLSIHPEDKNTIVDIRYSVLPHQLEPLWGIRLNPDAMDKHVERVSFREGSMQKRGMLWKMIQGQPL